jgi:hypothetical protein
LNKKLESSRHNIPIVILSSLYTHTITIWDQLTYPYPTHVHSTIYKTITEVENIIILFIPSLIKKYSLPKATCKPSVVEQIIHRPTRILDPYLLSLQQNYYYPIATEPLTMSEPRNDNQMQINSSSITNETNPSGGDTSLLIRPKKRLQ